jgi:hypothetical protein
MSVVVDNTRPSGLDVQTFNGAAAAGKPEAGDRVTYTFSEPIDPASVRAGWTGSSAAVVVRLTPGNLLGADALTVHDAGGVQLPFGTVSLQATGYVSAVRDFGSTGTPSLMTAAGNAITIVLGTASGSTGSGPLAGANMTWPPAGALLDRAGNACQTTSVTESDGLLVDREF